MDCEQVKPGLLEYLLEETPPAQRGDTERHLRSCHSCSEELNALRQTLSLVARAEQVEEIPRNVRIVAEPVSRWRGFWLNPARLAFAGGGLLCFALALLALFRTTIVYQEGSVRVAFGAPALAIPAPATVIPAAIHQTATPQLSEAQVQRMILDALAREVARIQTQQQGSSAQLAKTVSQELDEKWQRDLREMGANLRIFQSAQTLMWKEQVQNQQLVSTLMQQSGMTAPARP